MKTFIAVAALAVGLVGFSVTAADAHPHHRHCISWGHHHHHCHRWGW